MRTIHSQAGGILTVEVGPKMIHLHVKQARRGSFTIIPLTSDDARVLGAVLVAAANEPQQPVTP